VISFMESAEFVRGISGREWISCQTFSLRACTVSIDVWPLGMGMCPEQMCEKSNMPGIGIFRLMMATLPS
jgi:hypothetical protein